MVLTRALELGPDVWDRVALTAPFPSVFMSWAWHAAWYEHAPQELKESAVVLTDANSAEQVPRVLVPLTRRRISLHRIPVPTHGWCAADVGTADHLDILSSGAAPASIAASILALPWKVLVLTNLTEGFPGARALLSHLEAAGCRFTIQRLWASSQIELPDTWDAYLGMVSSKRRARIRKDERDLRAKHAVEVVDFGRGDRAKFEEGWRHLVRLHESRWHGEGTFASDRLSRTFRRFAELLREQGRLGLFGLAVDGTITCVNFWAEFGGTMFGVQSGRDPAWNRWSVGRVLHGITLQHAIHSGLKCADFSRATDAYKREWCPSERWCYELRVFRPGLVGRTLAAWDGFAERIGKLRNPPAKNLENEPRPAAPSH